MNVAFFVVFWSAVKNISCKKIKTSGVKKNHKMVANRMRATKKYVREKPPDDTNLQAADEIREEPSKIEQVEKELPEVRFKSHMFNHTKLEGR